MFSPSVLKCCFNVLGVAFEQGKFLPTPETVPFRLTRDLVDGMGLTGVEGVYRRCCEKTMDVMRTSQESLMTIVEVRSRIYFHLVYLANLHELGKSALNVSKCIVLSAIWNFELCWCNFWFCKETESSSVYFSVIWHFLVSNVSPVIKSSGCKILEMV